MNCLAQNRISRSITLTMYGIGVVWNPSEFIRYSTVAAPIICQSLPLFDGNNEYYAEIMAYSQLSLDGALRRDPRRAKDSWRRAMIPNKEKLHERFLRDPLPRRLGGLAATLARVSSVARKSSDPEMLPACWRKPNNL